MSDYNENSENRAFKHAQLMQEQLKSRPYRVQEQSLQESVPQRNSSRTVVFAGGHSYEIPNKDNSDE